MALKRITALLLILYILLTVYSILVMSFGWKYDWFMTPINTLAAFTFALLHAGQRMGWRRAVFLLGVVFLIGITFESIGVATGLIYGSYHYSDRLGPKFLGLVPYLIPLAWFMMTYPSFVIAEKIMQPGKLTPWLKWFLTAALCAVIMTAWDLVMDPIMTLGQHWIWEISGSYFGIPVQNFIGWWLTTFIAISIFLIVSAFVKTAPIKSSVPERWAVYAYALIGGGTVVSALLAHLDGPALVGVFAMLPWIVAGLKE